MLFSVEIKPKDKFRAPSEGKPNMPWVVTRVAHEVKIPRIYCRCKKTQQHRKYTGKQFWKLIREGIITFPA